MHKDRLTTRSKLLLVTMAAAMLIGGCARTRDFVSGFGKSPPADRDAVILGAPEADVYLQELYELAAGDPARQAEIFADAQSASMLTPGPQTNLRYALVLATPGHPGANAEEAQSMLREVLAAPELLTPAEIALATIHLKQAEEIIVLNAEARRLRTASSRASQTEQAAAAQRLATVEEENRRLRTELEEAEEKLEAITTIERSIREQEP